MFSTELAEIVLIVEDVERSARFYRDVVGLVPENEPDDGWPGSGPASPAKHNASPFTTVPCSSKRDPRFPKASAGEGSTTLSTSPAES